MALALASGGLDLTFACCAEAQVRAHTPSRSGQPGSSGGRTSRGRTQSATSRGHGRTQGSNNAVRVRSPGSGRSGSSGSSNSAEGWLRRRRVRERIVPGVVYDRCDYYDDGYCVYDTWDYVGESVVGLAFSVGVLGGLFPSDISGLSNGRVLGPDLSAGILPTYGLDARAWLTYGRLRLGGIVQVGGASAPNGVALREGDIFEAGSEAGDGWMTAIYGFAAYQPQLSELVQLWLGARVGYHALELPVRSIGRAYTSVGRGFLSAGPEIGVRLSAGTVGVMLWGFADLAQPGSAQLVLAFVFEEPKPPGSAF